MHTHFGSAQDHFVEKISGLFIVLQITMAMFYRAIFIHDQVTDTVGNVIEDFSDRRTHLEKRDV